MKYTARGNSDDGDCVVMVSACAHVLLLPSRFSRSHEGMNLNVTFVMFWIIASVQAAGTSSHRPDASSK